MFEEYADAPMASAVPSLAIDMLDTPLPSVTTKPPEEHAPTAAEQFEAAIAKGPLGWGPAATFAFNDDPLIEIAPNTDARS